MRHKGFAALLLAITGGSISLSGQASPPPHRLAKIRVIAFDTNGRLLGPPVVTVFDSDEGNHLAAEFHAGMAVGVPYGTYRIKAHLTAYASDVRYVRVYQPSVTIIVGLTLSEELPEFPPTLRGRIKSQREIPKQTFVRLVGLYSAISIDASVAADGAFELGGLSAGRFLLLVIDNTGVLTSKIVTIPDSGLPLELDLQPPN